MDGLIGRSNMEERPYTIITPLIPVFKNSVLRRYR